MYKIQSLPTKRVFKIDVNFRFEEGILECIKNLYNVKAMRRVGAVLRHQKAGFTANAMGVWIVAPNKEGRIERYE